MIPLYELHDGLCFPQKHHRLMHRRNLMGHKFVCFFLPLHQGLILQGFGGAVQQKSVWVTMH